jgi:4-hydroxybenzoate polyprenyltransferase
VTSAPRAAPFAVLLKLVRFAHTLFAMPYAVAGYALAVRAETASGGAGPGPATFVKIVLAMVTARTAAMAFNRLVDREFDARNPRTVGRPNVTGEAGPGFMRATVVVASVAFVAVSYALNPLCGGLSFVALAVVLGYSYTKRFTPLAHFVLGLGLGLAPVGAWLAVRGAFDGASLGVVAMGAAVLFWTAGFDVIYACQDAEIDRREGLRSVPADCGVPRALRIARFCHVLVPVCLAASAVLAGLGPFYWAGTVAAAALLAYEHRLVRPDDLTRVNAAFFNVNVAVAFVVMTAVLLDLWRGGAA